MECIILAGGLGTRLRSSIGNLPKCMAPVNGKPFLHYLFRYLADQRCSRAVLSLGFGHDIVLGWLSEQQPPFPTEYVIEEMPLGTGGGIKLALGKCREDDVVVLNGDTFFDISLRELQRFRQETKAATALALKPMEGFERYGSVVTRQDGRILSFDEKQYKERGLINGGVYALSRKAFPGPELPERFSFEQDYLEAKVQEGGFSGKVFDGYFIDIGVPEDYERAQQEFKTMFE